MGDLDTAKQRLTEALSDKCQRYWDLMKSWYRRRISKDDFDSKARALLGDGSVHLHNEFLFAILVKCQTGLHPGAQPTLMSGHAPSDRPHTKRKKPSLFVSPLPYGCLDPLQYHPPPVVQLVSGKDLDTLLLCQHELLLPELSTLHTRMLLGAWEEGLESVDKDSAQLLMYALESQLKSVLQALIAHRSSWRLRHGCVQYSFGSGLASHGPPSSISSPLHDRLHLASSNHPLPTSRLGESANAARLSQSIGSQQLGPLDLFDLRDTMKMNRQCVPVHWVYACTMERILSKMWHQSREEEEQERTVECWRQSHATPACPTLSGQRSIVT